MCTPRRWKQRTAPKQPHSRRLRANSSGRRRTFKAPWSKRWKDTRAGQRKGLLSASNLAQMGTCERLVLFEAKYGKRRSWDQEQAIKRGRIEHDKFFRHAIWAQRNVKTSLSKPWCFCASLVWGELAPETRLLRAFRDDVLRTTAVGRWLIKRYYKISPRVCRVVRGRQPLAVVLRLSLTPALCIARIALLLRGSRRSGP